MAAPTHAPSTAASGAETRVPTAERRGWLVFSGVMLLLAAASNAMYGIAALADDGRFHQDEIVIGELALWGGCSLVFAAVQLAAGVLVLRERPLGVVAGSIIALLHGLATVVQIGAYPLWSVTLLVIDGLILYGLSAYSAAHQQPAPES